MRALAALLVLVTATGGCAIDSADPEVGSMDPPAEDPWPCASRTVWASGKETVQTYAWDAHHNLVRKDDGSGGSFRATFDPSGTIATEEITEAPESDGTGTVRDSIHRLLDNGRIAREERTISFDGSDSSFTTTFRYEGGRLVEKHTVGDLFDVLTTVYYQAPDIREEDDEVRSGPLRNGFRFWKGDPWYEFHDIRVSETIVARDLDAHGRELRVKRWTQGNLDYDEVVDIERAPNGAPVREVWVRKDGANRTITYQAACP